MNLCVNVITTKRPNYLYVCLDSIFKNTIVPDVYVYMDKLEDGSHTHKENFETISDFDVRGVFVNKEHNGVGNQFWSSFEKAFDMGYDYVMYIEDDWLITTDAIQWLYECPKIASYYSVHRWSNKFLGIDEEGNEIILGNELNGNYTILKNGECLSWCLAFHKDGFEFINDKKKARAYLGDLPILSEFSIERMEQFDWDQVIMSIASKYNLIGLIPPRSLLAHFGNRTCMLEGGYGGSGDNIQDVMFCGDKTTWLNNISEIFKVFTKEQLGNVNFAPDDFVYH